MPSRPSSPISRSRSVGHRASSHASGRPRGDLLLGEVAAEPDQLAFGFGEREVHGAILWTDRYKLPYTRAMASDRTPHPFPTFDDVDEERRHRKQRLAAAFRLFGQFGFDEGAAGHITARDPELLDHFWVNPLGMNFKQIRVKDLLLVNDGARSSRATGR